MTESRLTDNDLNNIEAAALGRTGLWVFTHPADVLRLVEEVRRLREELEGARDVCRSLADRCAGQSELLAGRAEKRSDDVR
jgi:hypothetical protein